MKGDMPSCIDPTYCLESAPIPTDVTMYYNEPLRGSLRYDDGERIIYSCTAPGKNVKIQWIWIMMLDYFYRLQSQGFWH